MGQFNLNEKQKEAVEFNDGDLLIIAGAGTGKTQVITKRILHIIEKGWAKPSEILALTFTEKAAQEMEDRVVDEMQYGYEQPFISTFHSFCDAVLREDGYNIGIDGRFSLMNKAQSYILLRKHLYDLPLKTLLPKGSPKDFLNSFLSHVSKLQDEDVAPEDYLEYVSKLPQSNELEKQEYVKWKELAETYKKYSDIKLNDSKLDFGDLIILALKLFRERKNVLEKYRKKFKYILVDEFQDSNYTQNVLINTLVLGSDIKDIETSRPNLTVVGDDDQSIYKFRGAAISNILQFKETYPDAKEVVLTENYRSKQEILDSAYALIKHNNPNRLEVTEGIDKRLVAKGAFDDDQDSVNLMVSKSEESEAELVTNEILRLTGHGDLVEDSLHKGEVFDEKGQSNLLGIDEIAKGKYKFSDIAILVRANNHADIFIQSLRYKGVPYKLGGARGLYFRDEIKELICFLRVLVAYTDDASMYKLLSLPIWKLTSREYIELNTLAREKRQSMFEQLEQLWSIKLGEESNIDVKNVKEDSIVLKILSDEAVAGVSTLLEILNSSIIKVKEHKGIVEILYEFIMNSGFLQSYLEEETPEHLFAISNINKYFELIKKYEKDNPDSNIYEYVDYLNYSIETGESPLVDQIDMEDLNAVNIMTVHGSKGLEFPIVFMVNLVSQRFPAQGRKDSIPMPDELVKEVFDKERNESEESLEEERRLFYVGATRAKEKLFLTAANFYGDAKRKKKPSVFLSEILSRGVEDDFDIVDSEESKGIADLKFLPKDSYESIIPKEEVKNLVKRFSYSQHTTYEKCPRRYEYSYLLKIPQKAHSATSFGNTIHNTLKDFYKILLNSQEGLDGIFEAPTLEDLLSLYEKNWVSSGYESKKQEELRKKEGVELMKQYYEKVYSSDERPFKLEESVNTNIGNTLFTGQIDRIDIVGEESGVKQVCIVDYKTGNEKKDADIKKDLQLPLYALLVEQKLGLKVVSAKYIFIETCKVVNVDISEAKREKAKEQVLESIDLIESGQFNPLPNMWNCRHCDYNSICEYAEV